MFPTRSAKATSMDGSTSAALSFCEHGTRGMLRCLKPMTPASRRGKVAWSSENKEKLEKEIKKNGQSIETGKVVTVTDIAFSDDKIELELDGGGKNKKSFVDRIQVGVGMGNTTTPVGREDKTKKAKGSKIVLRFAKKVPADLKPEALKEMLAPVLDFNKRNFLKTGVDALPPEFQEAVKSKEARIGMDRSTVIMALGRPDKKVREKREGTDVEDWIYFQRGLRAKIV